MSTRNAEPTWAEYLVCKYWARVEIYNKVQRVTFLQLQFFVNLGVGKVQGHLNGYSVKHREVKFMMPGANPIKLFTATIYKFL